MLELESSVCVTLNMCHCQTPGANIEPATHPHNVTHA